MIHKLQEVDQPYFDLEACKEALKDVPIPVEDFNICAGGVKGKGNCNGDSGGKEKTFKKNLKHSFPLIYNNLDYKGVHRYNES